MTDIFSKKRRSEIMALIVPKNTKAEIVVFRYLRKEGIHFQKHYRKVPCSPDVALPRKKRAVLIDGDFWHGWQFQKWRRKLPKKYWREKIEANIRRDKRQMAALRRRGWKVLRVWEHQLKPINRMKTLSKIKEFLLN